MSKLAAVILACNEDNVLPRCLASLREIAELHVSIDTATTDDTEAVARRFTQNVYRHSFAEVNSYGACRNALQEQAEANSAAEWFLWIDPDEWLEAEDAQKVLPAIAAAEERDAQALMVTMYDLGPAGTDQVPASWLNSKVFRRGMRFARRRHEHLTPTDYRRLECANIRIHHQKAQRPEVQERHNALKDNLQALVEDWEEFRDQRGACYVGNAWANSGRWEDAIAWYNLGLTCPDSVVGARAQLLQGLVRCYRAVGQSNKARSALFEFWSEDWRNVVVALFDLGCIAVDECSVDEAATYFRLLSACPDNIPSGTNIGARSPRELSLFGAAMVDFRRRNYGSALEYLTQATVLAGSDREQYAALRRQIVAALSTPPEATT